MDNDNKLTNIYILLSYCLIIASSLFKLAFIGRPLIGHYDSAGQLYSLLAISLNKYGFFKLRFIPVNNSGLLTNPPDYYAHWPLLYPNLVAVAFKIFGPKLEIGRLISALGSTISCWLLFDIIKRISNARMAFFATVFFIMSPIQLYYSFWFGATFLALALWLAAIRSFFLYVKDEGRNSRHLYFACIWFAIASLISWEPVVTVIGLAIIYFLSKDTYLRRAALMCGAILVTTFVVHHVYILLVAPHLLVDQISAFLMRSYGQKTVLAPRPPLNWLFLIAYNMYISFGIIILISSFLGLTLLIKSWRNKTRPSLESYKDNIPQMKFYFSDARDLFFPSILLISMPLFWFLAVPRQAFDHDFQCIIWLPFISLTAAYGWDCFLKLKKKPIIIMTIICLFCLIGTESFLGFKRYYSADYSNELSKFTKLNNKLKDTDILFVSSNDFHKPSTAFLTGCFVVKVTSKEEVLRFIKLRNPKLATRYLFLRYEPKEIEIKENKSGLLYYFKNIFGRYYKPLKWERFSGLCDWVKNDFPREELPGGLVLYDVSRLKNNLSNNKD